MGEVNMQNKTNSPEPSSPGGIQEGAVRSRPHPESTPQAVRQRRTDVVRQRPKEPSREAARQEKPADTRQRPVPVKDAGQNRQESIPQQVVVGRPKSERRPEPRPEPVIVDSPDIDSPKATLSKKQKNSPDGKDSRENRKFYFQKFGEISTLRKMLMLVFGLLFLWCLAPAFFSIRGIGVFASSAVMLSNARHYDAINRAHEAIVRVQEGMAQGLSGELLSMDLQDCLSALGEVTGQITNAEVLSNIFSKFCIGK